MLVPCESRWSTYLHKAPKKGIDLFCASHRANSFYHVTELWPIPEFSQFGEKRSCLVGHDLIAVVRDQILAVLVGVGLLIRGPIVCKADDSHHRLTMRARFGARDDRAWFDAHSKLLIASLIDSRRS